MEILATYIAKDGKTFNDPLKCEEYEKGLGIVKGSVADVIRWLRQLKAETYLHGLVYVREANGEKSIYRCNTICVEGKLDSFVNTENLNTDQLYLKATAKEVAEWLERFDKDSPVSHFLMFSEHLDMKDCGVTTLYNPRTWKEEKE